MPVGDQVLSRKANPANEKWEEQLDSKYVLVKENLRLSHGSTLMDTAQGLCYSHLMRIWFINASKLSQSQKNLNEELLSILSAPPSDNEENIERLERFLKSKKNNPDLKTILNLKRGESGLTVLHALASMAEKERGMGEHEVAMCLLLEAGADPNIQNNRGETPLHYAIGWVEAVQELLERKANPNIRDIKGKTPLDYATAIGDLQSTSALLESGAVSNIKDKQVLLGAAHYKWLNGKEHLLKSETLWDNLIPNQQENLKVFLHLIGEAQK